MAGLFVDTWGWLALRDKGDRRHVAAVVACEGALATGCLVTTDFILDETFTLLFRRLPVHKARESLEFLTAAVAGGTIVLTRIHPARFREAVRLRVKYCDKPEISFTDFTSMVVMRELGLSRILSEDQHFRQVGLGFELVP